MIAFTRFLRAGHSGKGDLMAELLADDGKTYPFTITPACFVNLFAGLWQAAAKAPHVATETGEAPMLEAKVQFAVANMKPHLALMSGPLTLLLTIDGSDIEHLQKQIREFQTSTTGNRPH